MKSIASIITSLFLFTGCNLTDENNLLNNELEGSDENQVNEPVLKEEVPEQNQPSSNEQIVFNKEAQKDNLKIKITNSNQLVTTNLGTNTPTAARLFKSRMQKAATANSNNNTSNAYFINDKEEVEHAFSSNDFHINIASIFPIPDRNSIVFSLELYDLNHSIEFVKSEKCALFEARFTENDIICLAQGITTDYRLSHIDTGGARGIHQANNTPFEYIDGTLFVQGPTFELNCTTDASCVLELGHSQKQSLWRIPLPNENDVPVATLISKPEEYVMNFHATSKESVFYRADVEGPIYDPILKSWNLKFETEDMSLEGTGNFIGDKSKSVIYDSNEGDPMNSLIGISTSTSEGTLKSRLPLPPKTHNFPSNLEAVITTDDGRVFSASRVFLDAEANDMIAIQQVLPFLPGTLHEIPLTKENEDIDRYFGSRGMIVESDYLFYLQRIEVLHNNKSFGFGEVINTVKLSTGEHQVFLTPSFDDDQTSRYYKIDSWQKSNSIITFVAVDQQSNIPHIMNFNIHKFIDDKADFFTSINVSDIIDSQDEIKDIVNLISHAQNNSSEPVVHIEDILINEENPTSISIKFSEIMTPATDDGSIYIKDQLGNEVPSIKLWLGYYLHLVPDTSLLGLTDTEYSWLDKNTEYTVGIDKEATLQSVSNKVLTFSEGQPNEVSFTISK